MTVLGVLGGTTFSVVGWVEVSKYKSQLSTSNVVSLYIFAAVYSVLSLLSLFGLIGAIRKQRAMVAVFFSVLVAHLTFSIFSGAFTLWNIFNSQGLAAFKACTQPGGTNTINAQGATVPAPAYSSTQCSKAFDIVKGVSVGVFIFIWLLEIWGCFIAHDYVSQLDEEEFAQWPKLGSDVEVAQVAGPRSL